MEKVTMSGSDLDPKKCTNKNELRTFTESKMMLEPEVYMMVWITHKKLKFLGMHEMNGIYNRI